MSDERKTEVFLGLTRPPLLFGIPFQWIGISVILSFILFMLTKTFLAYLAYGVFHIAGLVLARRDPNFMNIFITPVPALPPACRMRGYGTRTAMSRNSAHKSHALGFTARATHIGREKRVSTHLPFTHFVDVDIIGTRDGDMMLTLHLSGAPSETVDASVIEQRFNGRAHLFLTALSASVQIYHHFVRREEKFYPEGQLGPTQHRYQNHHRICSIRFA